MGAPTIEATTIPDVNSHGSARGLQSPWVQAQRHPPEANPNPCYGRYRLSKLPCQYARYTTPRSDETRPHSSHNEHVCC